MQKNLTRMLILEWLQNPVTLKVLDLVKEYIEQDKTVLSKIVLEASHIEDQTSILYQYRGRINGFEEILKIKELLIQSLEEGEKEDEISSTRT